MSKILQEVSNQPRSGSPSIRNAKEWETDAYVLISKPKQNLLT